MTLFAIVTREQANSYPTDLSLARACANKGIEYRHIICEDFELDSAEDFKSEAGDLLYRISISSKAKAIESMLTALWSDRLTTIYEPALARYSKAMAYGEIPAQIKAGLQIIPTCFVDETWLEASDTYLQERVDSIDGFPVICKALGYSHGQGVQRIESLSELRNILTNLKNEIGSYNVILRKYLADYRHFRLVVVDGKVMQPIEYIVPTDDFRTNAGDPHIISVEQHEIPSSTNEMVLYAVALRSSMFGGADILRDIATGVDYLAEVNVPCFFPRSEMHTGEDIAGVLVDALYKKALERSNKPPDSIGRSEYIDFPSQAIHHVPARIDTGAKTSAVWASSIIEEAGILRCVLFGPDSKYYTGDVLEFTEYSRRVIASSIGVAEQRYVVMLPIKLGKRTINASFSLANRAEQAYPVLVGRNVLRGKFIVNVKKGSPLTAIERQRSSKLQSDKEKE